MKLNYLLDNFKQQDQNWSEEDSKNFNIIEESQRKEVKRFFKEAFNLDIKVYDRFYFDRDGIKYGVDIERCKKSTSNYQYCKIGRTYYDKYQVKIPIGVELSEKEIKVFNKKLNKLFIKSVEESNEKIKKENFTEKINNFLNIIIPKDFNIRFREYNKHDIVEISVKEDYFNDYVLFNLKIREYDIHINIKSEYYAYTGYVNSLRDFNKVKENVAKQIEEEEKKVKQEYDIFEKLIQIININIENNIVLYNEILKEM